MRQSFEAGGTQLWGAQFDWDSDSDSEMTALATIKESEEIPEAISEHGSHLETHSYTESNTTSMKKHQTELRSSLLKHKQLWQKAAKIAKQGGTEHRRRSILEDIGLIDFQSGKKSVNSSIDDEEDDQTDPPDLKEEPVTKIQQPCATQLSLPKSHTKVLPLSSSDIEKNVKPQLRPDRKIWGFLFPRMPTQFTTELNESLYQRYYSHKRKKTMLMVNILYIALLLGLYVLKILPVPSNTSYIAIEYILRETIITVLMLVMHLAACLCIRKANSCKEIVACAHATWILLALHTQISSITSFIDYRSTESRLESWNSFGTWQTALAIATPFGFLSIIPLRRMLLLSLVLTILHTLSTGVLTGIYDPTCLPRVSAISSHEQ